MSPREWPYVPVRPCPHCGAPKPDDSYCESSPECVQRTREAIAEHEAYMRRNAAPPRGQHP